MSLNRRAFIQSTAAAAAAVPAPLQVAQTAPAAPPPAPVPPPQWLWWPMAVHHRTPLVITPRLVERRQAQIRQQL